jgi:hypothetical protein
VGLSPISAGAALSLLAHVGATSAERRPAAPATNAEGNLIMDEDEEQECGYSYEHDLPSLTDEPKGPWICRRCDAEVFDENMDTNGASE